MAAPSYHRTPDGPPLKDRVRSTLLALVLLALILIPLFTFVPTLLAPPPRKQGPNGFSLLPDDEGESAAAPKQAQQAQQHQQAASKPVPEQPKPVVTPTDVPPPPPSPVESPVKVIWLNKQQFASTDITGRTSATPDKTGNGSKGDSDDDDGGSGKAAGTGPGGERLYNAQWYREPSHAEMATYLSKARQQSGWGEIICRTIPNYGVEDCRELGDTPGSGIARAMRQAAWQFKIRPPTKNGKPLIGSWVRIHFDYTVRRETIGGDRGGGDRGGGSRADDDRSDSGDDRTAGSYDSGSAGFDLGRRRPSSATTYGPPN